VSAHAARLNLIPATAAAASGDGIAAGITGVDDLALRDRQDGFQF